MTALRSFAELLLFGSAEAGTAPTSSTAHMTSAPPIGRDRFMSIPPVGRAQGPRWPEACPGGAEPSSVGTSWTPWARTSSCRVESLFGASILAISFASTIGSMDSATRTLAGQPFVIKLTDIETEAGWRLSRAGIELNGVVRPDWAGRPSVPADVATELYGQLVEERARLANERARESDERDSSARACPSAAGRHSSPAGVERTSGRCDAGL